MQRGRVEDGNHVAFGAIKIARLEAKNRSAARLHLLQSKDAFECRCLAGAIEPYEAMDRAALDSQVEIAQHVNIAVALRHSGKANHV